ncbi:uncharacterized protein SPAPADRAFT_68441 [Spathaspora passalidarum NRRL Y-27907]|uniref:Mid2 domain-containing protein n=1 Tax=Spathaspora passalidarum (strain NRRL Y-27907 / 11-Y1) TaxID=619300 RepID=G3ATV0_SPAPN|nr:uncharacterized protein SPAPADRAFT_68441 [Spathaspora passalidarum NRRL Y-27907]EGW30326.1 hypothetical protein SPAPADRAFT_68441 [Spathaspora passalidarum NRRL Y-27907]
MKHFLLLIVLSTEFSSTFAASKDTPGESVTLVQPTKSAIEVLERNEAADPVIHAEFLDFQKPEGLQKQGKLVLEPFQKRATTTLFQRPTTVKQTQVRTQTQKQQLQAQAAPTPTKTQAQTTQPQRTQPQQTQPQRTTPQQTTQQQTQPQRTTPQQTQTNKPQQTQTNTQPNQNKPQDNKPEDNKPTENKPEDKKPDEEKPEDKKPEEEKPEDKKPEDDKSDDKSEEKKPEDQDGDSKDDKPEAPKVKPDEKKPDDKDDKEKDDKPAVKPNKPDNDENEADTTKPKLPDKSLPPISDLPPIQDRPKTYSYDVQIPVASKSNPYIYQSNLPTNIVFIIVGAVLGFIFVSFAGIGLIISLASRRVAKREKGFFQNDSNPSFPDSFYYGAPRFTPSYGSSDTRVNTDESSFSQGRSYRDTLFGHGAGGGAVAAHTPSICVSGVSSGAVASSEKKPGDNRRTMFVSPTLELANNKRKIPSYYKTSMERLPDNSSTASLSLKPYNSSQFNQSATFGRSSYAPDSYYGSENQMMMSETFEQPYYDYERYGTDRFYDGYDDSTGRGQRPPSQYLNNLLKK